VSFKAETSGNACAGSATWTWGDGNSTNQGTANGSVRSGGNGYYIFTYWFNFTHTYRYIGEFVAQFDSGMGSVRIYVGAVGGVSLSAVPTSGRSPLIVMFSYETFLATSGYSASWTFGDGNGSHQSNPNGTATIGGVPYEWWNYTHTYRYGGSFQCLVNVSLAAHYAYASAIIHVNWPVEAGFVASPSSGALPLQVSFSFETEYAVGYSATWRFGDGYGATQNYPSGSRSSGGVTYQWWNCSHTYQTVGTFVAQVNVSSGEFFAADATTIWAGQVWITFVTFENWTTNWIPAQIQACLSGTCSIVSNGQSLILFANNTYTLTALYVPFAYFVSQWLTSAGSVSNATANSTAFTPSRSGNVSLVIGWYASWVGYVYSPAPGGQRVSMMSAVFSTPTELASTRQEVKLGIWLGIGGLTGTNLWQAGVQLNESGGTTTMAPFWEACSPGNCNTKNFTSLKVDPGDVMFVTLALGGGKSNFTIQDLTKAGHPSTSKSITYTPTTSTADWAIENFAVPHSGGVSVTSMVINGVPASLYLSYLRDTQFQGSGSYWLSSLLSAGTGGTQFSITYHD
jgi:hypothetical protein